ncbi:TlpA disulfide reductase family protein [uncultured Lutibacter sp.]|uniref:TlpA disulfide reductase family protein n=1 Tax=uncultured Lutibacter sp. TaxID=437739 RepID=UPI00261740BC|nr:TlpA disulfide reductase family protein [uncultured Lutibacter sp.]
MKTSYFFKLIAIVLFVVSCNEKPLEPGKYRINGTVIGLDNGEFYLSNYPNPVDTIKIKNGKFQIEKELKDIVNQISLLKDVSKRGITEENNLSLFVEPSIMTLNLNYEDFSKSKLEGSKTQNDRYRLDEIRNDIASNYKEEQEYFESIIQKYRERSSSGASAEELEAIKYEDNEAREKLAPMWAKQSEATLKFIKENPKSFISVHSLLYQLGNMKYNEAKALLDQFNPEFLKTDFGTRLVNEIGNMQKGVPGALAGNFDTIDINGNPIKLEDFKGKYLLIDFWASWCVPCRKGNPHLISLFKKYNPKGLEIIGVSDDDRAKDKWRKAVEKDQIGIWYQILRGTKTIDGKPDFNDKSTDISNKYNISSLPTKILVGPDGVIIGRYGGGGGTDEDMDKDLLEIFKN